MQKFLFSIFLDYNLFADSFVFYLNLKTHSVHIMKFIKNLWGRIINFIFLSHLL
jgi:hypothetical protein